jgi:hypothetical protein
LEDAVASGNSLVAGLKTIYERYIATKDILVKKTALLLLESYKLSANLPNIEDYQSIDRIKSVCMSIFYLLYKLSYLLSFVDLG